MRFCREAFACSLLIVCMLGCKRSHSRPANVPSSAIWVDNTFVECSVEKQSSADNCSVFRDDTGEILAEGEFVLGSSHLAAEKSELRYVAFGEKGIYLDDLRILVQRTASQRDPSYRVIDERLRTLASEGQTKPIDCNNVTGRANANAASECALSAFAEKKPFWVRYYETGEASFAYTGFAANADGAVYVVSYHKGDWFEIGDERGGRMMDDKTLVETCPKPAILSKLENGMLSCAPLH
jgi:hypothetical protein